MSNEQQAARWAAFTDRELGALLEALEAADREGSVDDVGKALWSHADNEMRRRLRGSRGPEDSRELASG